MRVRVLVLLACVLGWTAPVTVGASALDAAEGFGGSVTGGAGGEERWVTSLAGDGPGTLREALERPGRAWIRFRLSGRIELARPILVTSNKTVDGHDVDITVKGEGFRVANASNIVVTNLAFAAGRGRTTDAISLREGARVVWIDHCEFSDYDDGLIDITRGATDVTVSWSRFRGQDKVMLVNAENQRHLTLVTVHHNVFDGTNQRHPRVVGAAAEVHAYNNLVRQWTGYGMQAASHGTLLSEANVFDAGNNKNAIKSGGRVRSRDDLLLNGAVVTRDQTNVSLHRPDGYRAQIEPADLALRERLTRLAGRAGLSAPPPSTPPVLALPEASPPTSAPVAVSPESDQRVAQGRVGDDDEAQPRAAVAFAALVAALVVATAAVMLRRRHRRKEPPAGAR